MVLGPRSMKGRIDKIELEREEEVAKIDMERMVVVGGQEEDETSLLVKDLDGNIIKGVPVGISFLQKQNSRDYI